MWIPPGGGCGARPPLWPRPVCSDFSRQDPWAAWAWPCLPGPSGTLSFSCCCLFCLLQTCFCGRKRSISNLLSTVTKQPLVYSSPVGGRDGRGELGFQTRGGRALPAPLPGMLAAGGREHSILGVEGTTEVTPADGVCSPAGTVPAVCSPPPSPSSPDLRPEAAVLGGWEQLASKLLASPRPAEPAPHLLSPSKTVPSASSLGSSAWLCPATAARPAGSSSPSPGQAASSLGRANCPQLSTVTVLRARSFCRSGGRRWAVHPCDPPSHPGSVCSEYNEGGRTLKRGCEDVGTLLWLRLAWGAPRVTAVAM